MDKGKSGPARKLSSPGISLHSFVIGFVFGCSVFYAVWTSLGWLSCLGNACGTNSASTKESYVGGRARESVSPSLWSLDVSNSPESEPWSGRGTGCPNRLRILILILSSPRGSIRRNAIRGTWLHDHRYEAISVTPKFLIGTLGISNETAVGIEKEMKNFRDLILLPSLQDSYSNLSMKVLLAMEWVSENIEFDYIVKTDDDSYVRVDRLANALQSMQCPTKLYWGYFMGFAIPEPTGKWAEKKWFLCPHYLPYAMGGGYVLSQKAVSLLLNFPKKLRLYSNEDVTMATWLAPYRLVRKHDLRFDVESVSRGCNNNNIISHKERVKTLYEKYTSLHKNGTFCPEAREIRPAYSYNWTVRPLECCKRVHGLPVTNDLDDNSFHF